VTNKEMDELLHFLPVFEVPGRKFVERWAGGERTPDGATTMPYPVYTADVEQFFQLAGQTCWCDYGYNPAAAHKMLEDGEFIAKATLGEIKTMMTYCVRGERFCDGHWEAVLESGRITALLQRLAVLRMNR
jgi:hypothetical protein